MRRTSLCIVGVSALLIAAPPRAAMSADMVTKAAPPAAVTAPVACSGLWDFIVTSLPVELVRHNDLRHRGRGRDLAEPRHTL
jgi:hypothetical protein